MKRKQLYQIILLLYGFYGCSTTPIKKSDIFLEARNIKAATSAVLEEAGIPIEMAAPSAQAGPTGPVLSVLPENERFVYKAKFLGFTVGRFIISNHGKTLFNNREVYRFELAVKTSPFFIIIFKPKLRYVSYFDAEDLVIVRHEEYIDGGTRLESFVDFDLSTGTAFYRNLIHPEEKSRPIPGKIFDTLSLYFYLRMMPLELGDTIQEKVYFEDEIYEFVGLLESGTSVNLPGYGKKDAYFFKPYVFKDGKQVTKISAEVYLSAESPKKTLRAVLKTPLGSVSVVLEEE